jgi:hypothetical protein
MLLHNLRFAGTRDYFTRANEGDEKPFKKNFRKVYELEAPMEKVELTPIHKGWKFIFPDKSAAYLHPFQNNAHHRVGAYKLSRLLKFNIAPKVKAVKLSPNLLQESTGKNFTSALGTFCDWIPGPTYHDFIKANPDNAKTLNIQNIIELYLFSLISLDSDFHDRNIIIGPETQTGKPRRLYAIDSEKTGAKQDGLIRGLGKFPESLKNQIAGEDIPQETLKHIKEFLANRPLAELKLKPNFSKSQIDAFFKMASILSVKEEVPREGELESWLRTAYLPSQTTTPTKIKSPLRSHSSPSLNRLM